MAARVYKQSQTPSATPAPGEQPAGTWVVQDVEGVRLIATCRHIVGLVYMIFLLAVSPILAGIALGPLFRGQSLGLPNLFIGVPMFLFLLPFWSIALCYIVGRVEVTITRDHVRIFTGIGAAGISRWFMRSEIEQLETRPHTRPGRGHLSPGIRLTIKARREPVWFARLLTLPRRDWLAREMLRHMDINSPT